MAMVTQNIIEIEPSTNDSWICLSYAYPGLLEISFGDHGFFPFILESSGDNVEKIIKIDRTYAPYGSKYNVFDRFPSLFSEQKIVENLPNTK